MLLPSTSEGQKDRYIPERPTYSLEVDNKLAGTLQRNTSGSELIRSRRLEGLQGHQLDLSATREISG